MSKRIESYIMVKSGHKIIRIIAWLVVVLVGITFFHLVSTAERDEMERLHPGLKTIRLGQERGDPWKPIVEAQLANKKESNRYEPPSRVMKPMHSRLMDMNDSDKQNVTNVFNEKFLPALKNWFNAYDKRLPFRIDEVTVDKFHSTLGPRMHTYMIGDTTLTFVLPVKSEDSANVGYLMVKKAAVDMNSVPRSGFVPDLSYQVTREDVIRMVQADTGVEYKPNEVRIRPTGASSTLNGGAYVDILPTGKDPKNAMNYSLSLVFNSNGTIVNYERIP